MEEVGHKGPQAAKNTLLRKIRSKRQEIYKRWGCQAWKTSTLPFVSLPIFLVAIESIREMCGSTQGLFGMAATGLGRWIWGSESSIREATLTAQGVMNEAIRFEPSLATEGALWFPNLLVADPQLCLPFMLSGVILLNLFGKLPGNSLSASQTQPQNLWQKRLKRSFGVFALAIGPLTLHVPSAMLVYWISSSSFGFIQSVALDFLMPLPKPAIHKNKTGKEIEGTAVLLYDLNPQVGRNPRI